MLVIVYNLSSEVLFYVNVQKVVGASYIEPVCSYQQVIFVNFQSESILTYELIWYSKMQIGLLSHKKEIKHKHSTMS